MSITDALSRVNIRGAADYADTAGAIRGWCWSPDEPAVHRDVTIMLQGQPIATVQANRSRSDLLRVGIGDGRNAFDSVISAANAILREGTLLTAHDAATGVQFGHVTVCRPAQEVDQGVPIVEGYFDGVTPEGFVTGWCWFPAEADRHAEVVVVAGDDPLATLTANVFRTDLKAANIGGGDHGISFRLSLAALGKKSPVTVSLHEASTWTMIGDPYLWRVPSAGAVTAASPSPATAPRPSLDVARQQPALAVKGSLEQVSADGVVTGWCWFPDEPRTHVTVRVLVDDEDAGVFTAGSYRLDLQEACIGRGDHALVAVLPWHLIADKRNCRIRLLEAESGQIIGSPFTLRRRGLLLVDQRVRDLEQQVGLLRMQLDEVGRSRAAGYDQASRDLFRTIGTFFSRLGEAPIDDPHAALTADLRELLEGVTSRNRPLILASAGDPLATICIDGSASVDSLHICISALQAAKADRLADIVVVDDGNHEEAALLPALVRNLNYVRLPPGQSLLAGRNEIAMKARGTFTVFLSPEARVGERWLCTIDETFALEEGAAAIGSNILRDDGVLHHSGLMMDSDGRIREAHRPGDAGAPDNAAMRAVDALGDFAVAIRTADFAAAGGFDLGFTSTAAATFDLCLRLRQQGRTVLLQPAASVHVPTVNSLGRGRSVTEPGIPDEDTHRLRAQWFGLTAQAPRSAQAIGHALIIDTMVPHPDEDAGSFATNAQMQILRRLGYRVTFAAVGGTEPDAAGVDRLRRQGIEIAGPPHHEAVTDYLDEHGNDLDLVVVYRHHNMELLRERLRLLAPSTKTIFIPCDLHFLREERQQSVLGIANPLQVQALRDSELGSASAADATILASDFELDLLKPLVAPGKLHLLRWIADVHPPERGFAERSGLCFVAGFSHTPNVDGLLWFVQSIMPEILAHDPNIRLHVVGSNMPDQVRALASGNIVVHGWVKSLRPIFEQVRVAVSPLRFGAGFKGKIATSLAYGLPVVGTPVALEGTGLQSGDGVIAANDPRAFAEAVIHLHGDSVMWTKMSFQAIERCETLYSVSVAEMIFRGLLRDLGLPTRSMS
jgi:glycosyltransferase involved in cell wall biosynthesis